MTLRCKHSPALLKLPLPLLLLLLPLFLLLLAEFVVLLLLEVLLLKRMEVLMRPNVLPRLLCVDGVCAYLHVLLLFQAEEVAFLLLLLVT